MRHLLILAVHLMATIAKLVRVRVEVQADQLAVELKAEASNDPSNAVNDDRPVLRVPWKKTPMKRRREIIVPASEWGQDPRPMRAETRVTLVASIARGRRWLDEIVAGTVIKCRADCCTRQVQHSTSQYDDLARVPRA